MQFRLHSVGNDVRCKTSWKNFERKRYGRPERSADISENALILLQTYENHNEVHPNTSLYSLLFEKIPGEIPFEYFRWVAEQFN